MSQIQSLHESAGESYLPGQTGYPSLFRPSTEIPPFFASYRWWEDEATTVLWAFDADEIKRVIRFGLFRDLDLPRSVLQQRNESAVDTFLISLATPQEINFLATLHHNQKVEEIFRRCRGSSPPRAAWSWFPAQMNREKLGPRAIADAIDAESHLQFTRISFEEIVRYSLGYSSAAVEWFFQQHTAFFIHLYSYLSAYPEELPRFAEVETYLRTRSPFAHRALVRCLLAVQSGSGNIDLSTEPGPAFEFIADPIQRLFKDLPPSLTSILKVLSVLGVRFQRTYVHTREMSWTKQFNVAFSFLEDVLAATSPSDFSRTLMSADEALFGKLTVQGIMEKDAVTKKIITQWDMLSLDVWECCTGLPDMIPYIQECVQALALSRNYHSFTAVVNGLHKYSITDSTLTPTQTNGASNVILNPVIPPDLLYLITPFNNFAVYRQQFQESPGIPFLAPHIKQYEENGQQELSQMFQQMRTTLH